MVATAFGGLAFWAVLAQQDILAVASDETVQTLNAFDTVIFFAIINWGQAVFLLGASVVIIQSGVIARWIGWLGGVVALLNVVAALWTFTGDNGGFWGAVGAVAFVGFLIWTLAAAISMVRSGGGDGTPAPAHP